MVHGWIAIPAIAIASDTRMTNCAYHAYIYVHTYVGVRSNFIAIPDVMTHERFVQRCA